MTRFSSLKLIPIILIALFALFLRVYRIESVPISLNRDEVSMGYDAWSILKTGRDQFGVFLPLTLRSADDYKPAFYTYMIVPFEAVLGLRALAVRLPSVLFGVGTVIATFFLTRLFCIYTLGCPGSYHPRVHMTALLAAMFVAISPWHIQYSRGGFEANAALFFVTAGVALFLFVSARTRMTLFFSGLFFGLSLLTYHSSRVVTPVLVGILLLIRDSKRQYMRTSTVTFFLLPILLGVLLILPSLRDPAAQVRFRALSIFAKEEYAARSAEAIALDERHGALGWGRLFHNRRLMFLEPDALKQLGANYFRHLNPWDFFFGQGGPRLQQMNFAPGIGVVYWWEGVLALVGMGVLVILAIAGRSKWVFFLPLWFFLGFVPAAVTYDIPSYVRSILVLPTVQILAAIGGGLLISQIGNVSTKGRLRKMVAVALSGVLIGVVVWNAAFFFHQYFVHMNDHEAEDWRYGRKEAAQSAWRMRDQYGRVVVSTLLDDPHAHFLFHLKIDPAAYLAAGGTRGGGWTAQENRLENIEFRRLPGQGAMLAEMDPGVLYVGLAGEFPPIRAPTSEERAQLEKNNGAYLAIVEEIIFPNGTPGILLVEKRTIGQKTRITVMNLHPRVPRIISP